MYTDREKINYKIIKIKIINIIFKGLNTINRNLKMKNGDWGLGIGPIPNPQSPIPNPQSPIFIIFFHSHLK